MRKKSEIFLLYFTLFFGLLIISGCHQSSNESTDKKTSDTAIPVPDPINIDLTEILERGTLRAIVENSSTGFFIYKGKPMGYDHDLLSLFAESIGVELEIIVTNSIDEAFQFLDNGKGDVLAYALTITKERKERVNFTKGQYTTRQVLVQQKPEGWRKLTRDNYEDIMIRKQVDLAGKEVYVRKSSSYAQRLINLSDEIGSDIIIVDIDSARTEALIEMVSNGDIPMTVADESVALVNAAYYPNIDVKTPISFPQNIAWAVRKSSPKLLTRINSWIDSVKKEPTHNVIYNRYFKNNRTSSRQARSDYSSMGGDKISPYDDIIKAAADSLNWDWRLLSAQIYQESKFDPVAASWAGAVGLLQLVPETGHRFGAKTLTDPRENIWAGVRYMLFLDKLWAKTIKDQAERTKFVLGSYNVGLGHVEDARDLTIKYGRDPLKWDNNVEYYLKRKSEPKIFTDPIVKSGYCRGDEPVNYVREILNRFEQYKQFINS